MIRFKCPVCGVNLASKAISIDPEKIIECPNCHEKNPFKAYKRLVPKQDPKPVPAPDSETETETEKESKTSYERMKENDLGYFLDRKTGMKYDLPGVGTFSMGRKPRREPPFPDIAIVTEDAGMSRLHVNVKVSRKNDGRYHVFVSNKENRNGTYINGRLLQSGMEPELMAESVLKLNETELVYKKSSSEDETAVYNKRK